MNWLATNYNITARGFVERTRTCMRVLLPAPLATDDAIISPR